MSDGPRQPRESHPINPSSDLGIEGLEDPELIGRGGSGLVYRARQPRLNRAVAVKILDARADAAVGLGRFEREGFAMGTVAGHPHIVTVLSVGTSAHGHLFLLMPFLEGGSLADHVPMPWPLAVNHMVKICGAVESAHRAGVLHRDIKPGNVLLSSYGEPMLADFGISRVSGGFQTSEGLINASVPYAPPEVLDGRAPSTAGDLYSLGATLFCLIAGHPPFGGSSGEPLVTTYVRITRDPVPDLRLAGVPDALCRVMETTLAKDPGQRPRTAVDLGSMLQRVEGATGQPVTPMTVIGDDPTPARTHAAAPIPATPSTSVTVPAAMADTTAATTPSTGSIASSPIQPGTRVITRTSPPAFSDDSPVEAPAGQPPPGKQRWWIAGTVLLVAVLVAGAVLWAGRDTPPATADTLILEAPSGIAVASDGMVFIADGAAHRVHRVSPNGAIDAYAGTGQPGDSGNGRAAAEASIEYPAAVAVANDGTLYVATAGTVRAVDLNGIIHAVEGFDTQDGIIALAIHLDGTLYAANRTALYARTVDGTVSPVPITGPGFGHIESIAVHPQGWVGVSDSARDQIVRLDPITGDTSNIAGRGPDAAEPRDDGHPATDSSLSDPTGITFDSGGRLFLSEAGMNRVRTVQDDGTLLTIAGDPEGYSEGDSGDGGSATRATFRLLNGPLAVTTTGELLIGDVRNHRIRAVTLDTQTVEPYPRPT